MGGKGGEREKRGRGRAQTSTHKYKHGTTRHKTTQGKEGNTTRGNPKVGEGRSPDILLQGEVGVLNIQ